MAIKIVKEKLSKQELQAMAQQIYGSIVKIAVDVEKEVIALGCEWHAECQEALVEKGSDAQDVWGANIKMKAPRKERLEYFALINIKPSINHREMKISAPKIREKIKKVVDELIE